MAPARCCPRLPPTMTLVSVTFSVMVVALTVLSQHFGPRLLNSLMRDNAAQLVPGRPPEHSPAV